LNAREIAALVGTKPPLIDYWRQQGLLEGIRLNDKNEYLYERPDADATRQIKPSSAPMRRHAASTSASVSQP
jgi:DNA-binding transcriptional MerR regulator